MKLLNLPIYAGRKNLELRKDEMTTKLKQHRFILAICLVISLICHVAYGVEDAKRIEDLENYNERLKAELQDKQLQIEIQDMLLNLQDDIIQDYIINEPEPEQEPEYIGTFTVTHYCPCEICCGKSDGITFTGVDATEGRTVAVDPEVIPLGSIVIIEGHEYIAEDIGGAIKGNKIDRFMDNHQAALNEGVVQAEVYIGG
jgi:3D (Asp-Asp-Asp) domain-containing protein